MYPAGSNFRGRHKSFIKTECADKRVYLGIRGHHLISESHTVTVATLASTSVYHQTSRRSRAFNTTTGRKERNNEFAQDSPGRFSLKWVPGKKTFWEREGDRHNVDHVTQLVPFGLEKYCGKHHMPSTNKPWTVVHGGILKQHVTMHWILTSINVSCNMTKSVRVHCFDLIKDKSVWINACMRE